MDDIEKLNNLRWELVRVIEPALTSHVPPLSEGIDEKIRREAIWRDVQRKADECIRVMQGAGFVPNVAFIASQDPP